MIIFKKISWKNFLSTGNHPIEVKLDEEATTLIIGANGAGKSTILDALTFVLYGKSFRKISKSQLINTTNEKNCEVNIEFSVNSTDTQALMVESLYTSYCSPIDDEMDNQTGEFPYGCGFSGASLKVNSTCNGATMTNTASSGIWLPTGNCIHEFGELGPFDEGHQHLAPYRNVTWNLMYTIHPVDAVN